MIARTPKEIGCTLCLLLVIELFSAPSALRADAPAADKWLIYADDDIVSLLGPLTVKVGKFQYVGYVQFDDPNDPVYRQPPTIKANEIYKRVFKDKSPTPDPRKPIITRQDDVYVVLYSLKAMDNFVCKKEEGTFAQTDAPLVQSTGSTAMPATTEPAEPQEKPVLAFLCDLESRDKGNTKITFTIGEPSTPAAPKEPALSQAVRVHELYRFRITSGPVFSSLIRKNKAFSTFTNRDGQQVISSSKANDAPVNFPIFLKCYCFSKDGRDILVDPPSILPTDGDRFLEALRDRVSPIVGINLVDNPLKNFYAGLSFEPRLGVDIVAGVHFAKLMQLTGGFAEGTVPAGTMVPATLPETEKFHAGWFVGVTVDVGVVGSWLGSQAIKTIKDGLQ
jgi:hypothetical protein